MQLQSRKTNDTSRTTISSKGIAVSKLLKFQIKNEIKIKILKN